MNNKTVQIIRYRNLQLLLQACSGNQAELARTAGTNPAYISQILNRSRMPSGKVRSVGERLARKLERAFGKPEGWMDSEESSGVAEPRASYDVAEARLRPLLDVARQLTPEQLPVAIDMLTALVKRRD
ncbi:MAG: helix-turn-helix transcriptional regulator [Porticoccaceae bacterium]|nr:helix-turn-helix transcriptional regulator [Porticoccaceae bacterium]